MKGRRIVLSASDVPHLKAVIEHAKISVGNGSGCVHDLEDQLDTADVVQPRAMPVNVVRMNSQVYVTDLDSGEETLYTLVFPQQADMERHRVSVLAPIGTALLGSRAGQVITPLTPGGRRRLRVGAIICERDAVPAA